MSRLFVFVSLVVLSICLVGCNSDEPSLPSGAEEALQGYLTGVGILRGIEEVEYNIVALEKTPHTVLGEFTIDGMWCARVDHPVLAGAFVLYKPTDTDKWNVLDESYAGGVCSPDFLVE